jgi:hypothetical protein
LPLLRAGNSLGPDLSTLEWLSEQPERPVMMGAREARASGARIVAAAPMPLSRESFAINRFDHIFRLYDTGR